MSICGCCKDAAISLLAQIWTKAHYWACFCTYVISLRFTPLYPRGWARRLGLKLEWNLYLASLIAKDDQVAMKLAPCCFTKKNSTNFSIVVNDVSVFFTCFSCLYFLLLSQIYSDASLSNAFYCIIFKYSFEVTTFWGYNMALRIIN